MPLIKKVLYQFKYRYACADIERRWWFKKTPKPHSLPGKLIVSLTSYPARFDILYRSLQCLLRQSIEPDHVILWIAKSDMPSLPTTIRTLVSEGLEIQSTDDTGSYKKILPALEAFPNAYICTADDDLYYHDTWLEELVRQSEKKVITCHRAHEITLNAQGEYKPYDEWINETRLRGYHKNLFPTGGAGALYPPGILDHSPEDREAALSLCPYGDDTWLYWIGRRNGARYKTVGKYRDIIVWRGSQGDASLWRYNLKRGGNDEQLRKIAQKYGYPTFPN